MLLGRLGLETARLPHADRHGLIFLDRGRLTVEDGCLTFECAGGGSTPAGRYGLPHQSVSLMLLGPGSTISHDALRLLARHNVGLAAVGEDGVRFYTATPLLPDFSHLARAQATFWADARKGRLLVARRMYALRLGEVLPNADITKLRGIEGARMKETYRIAAQRAGIQWSGRRYDRQSPMAADLPNQALNHAASAVEGAAAIAVAATATIPQLGFVHEDSGQSFVLDVADMARESFTVPCAFRAAALAAKRPAESIERLTRRLTGEQMRRGGLIPLLIDRIKTILADPTSEEASALPIRKRVNPAASSANVEEG
jgi:CRISPR-associated protein Cas1